MKHLVLTHADLDGIVSAINVYNIVKDKNDFQYMYTNYISLEKKLKGLIRETYDVLWILDLNIPELLISLLPTDKQIVWIDHHSYVYDINSAVTHLNCKFIHDSTKSASLLTFEFLNKTFSFDNRLKDLNLHADVYDNWRLNNKLWKQAYALNDLFWHHGAEKFFVTMRDGLCFRDEDIEITKQIDLDRTMYVKETIEKYIIFNEEFKIAYIVNPQCKYTNHFTLALYGVDYYIILKNGNENTFTYSIRLQNNELNLTVQQLFAKVKEANVNVLMSGGHTKVGSITVPYADNEILLEAINSILEGELTNGK